MKSKSKLKAISCSVETFAVPFVATAAEIVKKQSSFQLMAKKLSKNEKAEQMTSVPYQQQLLNNISKTYE